MSKFVKIRTVLRKLDLVKRALHDLGIQYQEDRRYVHRWGGFSGKVPILINHRHLEFGLRQIDDGTYEIVGDEMQMKSVRVLMDQVQQRYAYHMVLEETERAGFALVDEQTGNDNVIRLTVRRWS